MRIGLTIQPLCALICISMAASCGSSPPRQYFGMSYSFSDQVTQETPKYPFSLKIREPDIQLAYDRSQIVYRYDPYKFKYYNYKFWVAKPQTMVAELVYRHLKHTNLFNEVALDYQRDVPDYELHGGIDAIEEYDSGDTWYGHLAMNFRLVRFSDRKVVWAYRFDETKEVFTREPVYVVRALSELMDEQMAKMMPSMETAMDEEVAARKTESGGTLK